jgi:hypothetical protein
MQHVEPELVAPTQGRERQFAATPETYPERGGLIRNEPAPDFGRDHDPLVHLSHPHERLRDPTRGRDDPVNGTSSPLPYLAVVPEVIDVGDRRPEDAGGR